MVGWENSSDVSFLKNSQTSCIKKKTQTHTHRKKQKNIYVSLFTLKVLLTVSLSSLSCRSTVKNKTKTVYKYISFISKHRCNRSGITRLFSATPSIHSQGFSTPSVPNTSSFREHKLFFFKKEKKRQNYCLFFN